MPSKGYKTSKGPFKGVRQPRPVMPVRGSGKQLNPFVRPTPRTRTKGR